MYMKNHLVGSKRGYEVDFYASITLSSSNSKALYIP